MFILFYNGAWKVRKVECQSKSVQPMSRIYLQYSHEVQTYQMISDLKMDVPSFSF